MPFYDIITLVGFGFGVALSVTLFTLSMQRMPKRAIDVAFGILFLSFILWFGGQFLSLLVDLLFGSVAQLEVKTLVIISYAGLTLTPSSLLHIQLASLQSARGSDRLGIRDIFIILTFYVPFIIFVAMNAAALLQRKALTAGHSEIVNIPFALWMIFSITIFVTFSEKLIETVKYESDRRFYKNISYVLASIGLGVIVVYVFSFYRLPYAGQYLDLFMLLSPAIAMAVFLYYVYRYNFYRLVIKPSLVHSVIYGTVMAIYLVGIRRFGQYLSQFPEVNEELIEGLLLIALVFAFQPFRSMLQTRLDKIFFRDRYYYQQFLRELSDSISGIVDLEQLLQTIRHSMVATLKVTECTIIILHKDDDHLAVVKKSGDAEFPHLSLLISALQETRHFRPRRQLNDHRVFAALKGNNLALAMPVYFQQDIRGLIALAEKETGNPFSDDELDVLQTFANQIGLAIENARLVQERFELIERIHQAEKSTSLGQLATTMSHELKNPLSSIKTIVQVLHEKAEGEERQDLNLVMTEINRLHGILEKLLSYARPAETSTERIDVGLIIEEVLALLKHQAHQENIMLDFQRPDSMPALIAKRQSIREIVFNIVLNAIQAVEQDGTVRVSLSVGNLPACIERQNKMKDVTCLIFICQDDGPGIANEFYEKIFEPFYTSKTVGTGLGLAIVKRNVNELNGVIDVKSNARSGTSFTVYLPVTLENHLHEGE
ncbi:GAF domain-containing protein [candidate division KSB1 bacterium]|nr:GAF domain-containing protein [candidate division KSB1 bacterium]RQW04660.1 MAG: GAF domain-containing protein [candidate division KSB1 bacterium]